MLQDNKAAVEFVDGMINEKGLADLDTEVRDELRSGLLERLEDHINRTILNSLSDEQFSQFEQLMEENSVDKINEFLYKEGINVGALVTRAMTEFKGLYLASSTNA